MKISNALIRLLLVTIFETGQVWSTVRSFHKENSIRSQEDTRWEDKCPCLQFTGSSLCRPYDPHYQALTIEEAVLHFVDPTNPYQEKSMLGENAHVAEGTKPICTTPACGCCTLAVLGKIRQTLGRQPKIEDKTIIVLNATEQSLKRRYGKDKGIDCWKYMSDCRIDQTMDHHVLPNRSKLSQHRSKRQTTLGATTQLACNYQRGDALNDGSHYVGLCNLCWSIRTLPPNYFPRFINELTCDSDINCLSGWGTCRERTRSIDVMVNSGTESYPQWSAISINSPVACECQVLSGSAFHNLVIS